MKNFILITLGALFIGTLLLPAIAEDKAEDAAGGSAEDTAERAEGSAEPS